MSASPAETATAPRIRQKEQVQRRAVRKPSDSLTSNFTAPQWQDAGRKPGAMMPTSHDP
jgi:hypothetical protein